MYALIDCNNFFVSCERVRDRSLEGRPVVVASGGGGGCIISRSQEAKALGIGMGEPIFKVRGLLNRHKVAVCPTNFSLYKDLSHGVMDSLTEFSPEVEVYSVDEAFVNLRGLERHGLEDYSQQIRQHVKKKTGIPISIGLARTKTLSKLASHIAKKTLSSDGCYALADSQAVENAASWVDISEVWGIGRRYQKFLYNHNIKTVAEFMALDDAWVKRHMTIVGWRTHQELWSKPRIPLVIGRKSRQSIQTARTFPDMITDFNILEELVSAFAAQCAFAMRMESGVTQEICVFLATNPHRPDLRQYSRALSYEFEMPTASSIEIVSAARALMQECFIQGYHYKRAGIILNRIVPAGTIQYSLFDNTERRVKHQKLMEVIDNLNQKDGKSTLFMASQGKTRMAAFYNTFRPDEVEQS